MKVHLKCFSTLVNPETCDYKETTPYDLDDGQTVGDLVKRAGLGREEIKIAIVNGRIVDFETVLTDGDLIGLAPAVGGM